MGAPQTHSISELAKEFDVTTRTIRFYEEKGLLTPQRSGQHRIYSPADRVRLQLIVRGKRIGLSLEESREIIEMYDPSSGNSEQYLFLMNKVDEKREQLQRQMDDIQHLLEGLADIREKCEVALHSILEDDATH